MAVPKRKTSKMRRRHRRANHDRISAPQLSECPNCGELRVTHRVCPYCGVYRGRKIVEVEEGEE